MPYLTPLCVVIAVQDYLLSLIHGSFAETSVQLPQSCCTSSYSTIAFWASCTQGLWYLVRRVSIVLLQGNV